MLYGAPGYTGGLITARVQSNVVTAPSSPVGARSAVTALADRLDLPHRVLDLDDPVALQAALGDVDLVLNAASPFLHTAAPLAEACLNAGVHYLDISNELRVFRALYDLDEKAKQVGVSIIPGVGFGVVATNCLACTSASWSAVPITSSWHPGSLLPSRPRRCRDHASESPLRRLDP